MDVADTLRLGLEDRATIARRSACLSAVLLGLVAGCVLPSDQTKSLRLAFDAIPAVYVGDTVQLTVHAVNPSVAGVIRPADLVFESGNPAALDVTPAGLAVGKAADTASVTVRLRFADAPPVQVRVPVLATLRIDSIVPDTPLYFGDTVTVFGVGLNPQSTTVLIGGVAPQFVRFASTPRSPGGPGSLTVVVPLAASPAPVTARRGQTIATAGTTLEIVQHDRLEPNDSVPHPLGALGSVIRYPWLVLEGTALGKVPARDWFTFQSNGGDVTLVLKPAGVASVDEISLSFTDSLDASGNALPQGWVESVAGNYCRGTVIGGIHGVLDSQVVAAASLAPGTYHVMIGSSVPSTEPRGYELRIEQGYHSVVPNPYPTSFAPEPTNSGNCASPSAMRPGLLAPGAPGFTALSLIENLGAVGWFAFTVDQQQRLHYWQLQLQPVELGSASLAGAVHALPEARLDVFGPTGQPLFHLGTQLIRACLDAGDYLVAVSSASGGTGTYQAIFSDSFESCLSVRGGAP